MTDQDLEQRLRAWYLVEIDDKASAPLQLRTENATLAQAAARSRRRFPVSWSFHRLNFFGPFALGGTAIAVALLIGIGLLLRPSPVVGPPASQRPTLSAAPSHVAPSSAPTPSGPLGGGLLIGAAGPDPVDGTFDVFTLDAGTGEQTLLGTLPRTGSHETYHFQWGADRKHVLITATEPGGRVALERATDAARDLIFVCCEPGAAGGVLSPQSDRIASYIEGSSAIPGCLLCVDATASVAIVEVVGGKRSTLPLPDGTIGGGSVSWSPDGSAVVVTGCRPCNIAGQVASAAGGSGGDWGKLTPTAVEHAHLFIVPVNGSPVREVFDAKQTTVGSPAWSPNGTTIAFLRNKCPAKEHAPYCLDGSVQLVTMTIADGRLTVVADGASDFAWSPDGGRLAFGNASGLFVADADGGHLKTVAKSRASEPGWSPDGEWLSYSTYDEALDARTGPWIVAPDGGEPRLLGTYSRWAW